MGKLQAFTFPKNFSSQKVTLLFLERGDITKAFSSFPENQRKFCLEEKRAIQKGNTNVRKEIELKEQTSKAEGGGDQGKEEEE